MLIQDNHLGKIIGEPSANSVNGYGEVAYFYLPNTGLFAQVSTKKWYRWKQQKEEQARLRKRQNDIKRIEAEIEKLEERSAAVAVLLIK